MGVLFSHKIPGGHAWSLSVRAGRKVTFTALGDDAALSLLVFGCDGVDRLNIPDTLKAQMSGCIRAPMVLMSDRGLALASVVDSSLAWHDALTGFGHEVHLERFGSSSYAHDGNEWRRSARTGLLLELAKRGRTETDLTGCVNIFTKVTVDESGRLAWVPGHCSYGDTFTLRAEQDLLLVMSSAPHPMNPAFVPVAVVVDVESTDEIIGVDSWTGLREESVRALTQTRVEFA